MVRLLVAQRVAFLLLTSLFAGLLAAYAFLVSPRYTVAVKLVPRSAAEQAGGFQSLLGQFGGFAALAGASLGNSGDQEEALAWIRSRAFAERFIRNNGLMPIVFDKVWDSTSRSWRKDLDTEDIPTIDDAYELFDRRIRRVNKDQKTGIVTLEIVWKDRERAARWANAFVQQANQELRERALSEADQSLKFLESERQKTTVVGMQQAIYKLMEAQIKRKLLANTRPDYAFAVIDPAAVPDADRFTSPKRFLLILLAVPFGAIVAACTLIAWRYLLLLRAVARA
jgi:uncharacterized protein involved in exopolysaccharide biosynthesis